MSSRSSRRDHWDEEEDDDAEVAFDGYEDPDADEPTVTCPYCGRDVHEEAAQCPACGRYISAEDAPSSPKPLWIALGVIVCLAVVYCWIFSFPR